MPLSNQLTKHRQSFIPEGSPLRDLCAEYSSALTIAKVSIDSLPNLSTMKICNEGLERRVSRGSMLNGLSLNLPPARLGIFSKIGVKIDLLFSRWTLR